MKFKITSKEKPPREEGVTFVTMQQIRNLVDNYYARIQKKKGDSTQVLLKTEDSRSAWFSKKNLDQLFRDNGWSEDTAEEYGLRIYYGVHKEGILKDADGNEVIKNPKYFNQQMVVLVVTKPRPGCTDHDCLEDKNTIEIAIKENGNLGMDNGKLCPPEVCDGSVINK